MSENTERAITNGHSRESGNIEYTRRRKTKHNVSYVNKCKKRKQDMNPPTNNWRQGRIELSIYTEIVTEVRT